MKSVYTGGEKSAEFESYDELRVGENKPAFIYEGSELVYPNPVKDGLVLWYDFSGRTNTDGQRGIAEDLSGNGNHGTLQNFNYTTESGYEKNKLLFDGVDDYVSNEKRISARTLETTFIYFTSEQPYQAIISTYSHRNIRSGMTVNVYRNKIVVFGGSPEEQISLSTAGFLLEVGKPYHIIAIAENDKCQVFLNGEFVHEGDFKNYTPEQTDSMFPGAYLGRWNSFGEYAQKGLTGSARIYNRPLTPEEIAHNYAIEKERFNMQEV